VLVAYYGNLDYQDMNVLIGLSHLHNTRTFEIIIYKG
jgi:hypothetical protein